MYIKKKSKIGLSGFYIVYYGSIMNEKKGIYGISHIMEHLICKGFDKYMEQFEEDSINWNAYTSDNKIVFYMTGLDKYIQKWKKIFYESIQKFNITQEQFDIEKKIVIEEYKDSFNNQSESHSQNLYRKLFDYYQPIGLLEDLENLTLKDCQDYFEVQYRKPTMIIDLSKKNKQDKFFKKIEFDNRKYDKKIELNIKDNFIYEKGNEYKDKSSILNILPIYDDFQYVEFINRMLGGGLKSPIYKEIRERLGLVYYIHCYSRNITNKSALIIIATETSNDNVDKLQSALNEILSNPDKYMTKKRFKIVKKYYKNRFNKEKILIHNNGEKFFELEHYLLEKVLNKLTYKKIREVYDKYYNFSNFYRSVDKEEFLNFKTIPVRMIHKEQLAEELEKYRTNKI